VWITIPLVASVFDAYTTSGRIKKALRVISEGRISMAIGLSDADLCVTDGG
jgi:hypothetical protein